MFKRLATFLFGIGLIVFGVLFFIEQERHFVAQLLTEFWPLFLVIAGLVRISGYFIDRHPHSPLGGMITVALGGILLAANLRGEHSIVRIFGDYWFWLLLALVSGRILRQYTHRLGDGPRPAAFSPASIILMMLIAGSGLGANYLVRKTQPLPNLGVANFVFGKELAIDDPPQTFPLSRDSQVIIDGAQGDIEISGANQPQASVQIIKKIRAFNKDEARRAVQDIHLQISHDGEQIHISAPPGLPQDIGAAIVLVLPQNADTAVEVNNCTGKLKLSGLRGNHIIRNGDDIEVNDFTGNLRIENPGGEVELKRIRGSLNLTGARGDSVSLEDIEGPASVEARGDITVLNFLDALDVRSEYGTIKLSTNERIAEEIKATNGRGRIQVFIPDDSGFRLDAISNHGGVRVRGFNQLTVQRRERANVLGYNVSSTGPNIVLRANSDIVVQSSGLVAANRVN
ncbi:MAG: DUF4097 family beta strand repeat protein [Blastocatellia bacterium]|nr:DUF4097 family beta strand repeat protein [Blastocatellia bacterium]